MYGREVDGQVLTFGVSGKLIMNALVMYDRETDTLSSQFLRMGVKGPMAGVVLDVVPVTQMTWAGWREFHRDTVVLDARGGFGFDLYDSYYSSGSAGVLGETVTDDRVGRKELVLGVGAGENAKAYPFRLLGARPVVNDSVAGQDLLVFFDPTTDTALVFDRRVNGTALTFRVEGDGGGVHTVLVDDETGSRWIAFTGSAIDGQLKGQVLARIPSHLSFWFAWKDWNPDTKLFTR